MTKVRIDSSPQVIVDIWGSIYTRRTPNEMKLAHMIVMTYYCMLCYVFQVIVCRLRLPWSCLGTRKYLWAFVDHLHFQHIAKIFFLYEIFRRIFFSIDTYFFYKQHIYKQRQAEIASLKIISLNFRYLKIIHILHLRYISKIASESIFIQLITMKIKMKMKNRSHRYDINRRRSRHGHKYSKHKKCLSMMMLICIKQHPEHHLKLNSWKSWATLRLSWKKALLLKKGVLFTHTFKQHKTSTIARYFYIGSTREKRKKKFLIK